MGTNREGRFGTFLASAVPSIKAKFLFSGTCCIVFKIVSKTSITDVYSYELQSTNFDPKFTVSKGKENVLSTTIM